MSHKATCDLPPQHISGLHAVPQTGQATLPFSRLSTYCFLYLETLTPKHLQDWYLIKNHSANRVYPDTLFKIPKPSLSDI